MRMGLPGTHPLAGALCELKKTLEIDPKAQVKPGILFGVDSTQAEGLNRADG